MTQSLTRPRSFRDLLDYDDGTDATYELTEGELIEVAPESEVNAYIAECLKDILSRYFSKRLIKIQKIYIEVAPLPGMPLNREPDLVVFHPDHPKLMALSGKMAISNDMPAPQMVVEVVSPYPSPLHENFTRDYSDKPQQYAIRGIPEYWIVDPQRGLIEVNWTPDQSRRCYSQSQTFQRGDRIVSSLPKLADLNLTTEAILNPG